MTKREQAYINSTIIQKWEEVYTSWAEYHFCYGDYEAVPLRSCKAEMIFDLTPDVVLLVSYRTLVAFYDTKTNTLYDMLRYQYGYTATSAQHIAKFRDEMSQRYHVSHKDIIVLRYYSVA